MSSELTGARSRPIPSLADAKKAFDTVRATATYIITRPTGVAQRAAHTIFQHNPNSNKYEPVTDDEKVDAAAIWTKNGRLDRERFGHPDGRAFNPIWNNSKQT